MARRSSPEVFDPVIKALAGAKRPVTVADVTAQTGLRPDRVEMAMRDAMLEYDVRLLAREDGSLVYDFGTKLSRRGRRSVWDWVKRGARAVYKGFKVAFKLWTAVMLVGYVVVFSLIIIAALIALSVVAEEDIGVGDIVGGLFRIIFELFAHVVTYSLFFDSGIDRFGYSHKTRRPKTSELQKKFRRKGRTGEEKKSFVASIYDFIFGPERAPFDAHAQTREVISFVRENLGLLTVGDVQALSGFGREKAETFFSKFAAEFDGDVHFDNDGTLWATFPKLLESAGREEDEPIVYYWDEYEPPFVQSGNAGTSDAAIIALNTFNLGMGAAFSFTALGAELSPALAIGLGAVPFVFSLLFFAIPLVRAAVNLRRNRAQHLHNIRKRIFRAAFKAKAESVRVKDLLAFANDERTTEEILKLSELDDEMRAMVEDIGGELDTDDDGELVVRLSGLRRELNLDPRGTDSDGLPLVPEQVAQPQVVFDTVSVER